MRINVNEKTRTFSARANFANADESFIFELRKNRESMRLPLGYGGEKLFSSSLPECLKAPFPRYILTPLPLQTDTGRTINFSLAGCDDATSSAIFVSHESSGEESHIVRMHQRFFVGSPGSTT